MNITHWIGSLAVAGFSVGAFAKLPPAPPPDPVAVAAKAEKDKAVAEKGKALQVAAEERAVKNYQANMKKAGKPIPKPTPIVVAAAPAAPATVPVKPVTASAKAAAIAPERAAKK